ncbi:MAG: SIMPL domain-containing protein [Cyanobium sp.]
MPGRSLPLALALGVAVVMPGQVARAEVQLRCDGTLLEARGSAEQTRPTRRLQVSLSLEAEAASNDGALAELQRRLAAVRSALQRLGVQEFRASSPSTWQRPAEPGRPATSQANLQVTGRLMPQRLQPLIREVGALAGVRLAPVSSEADPSQDETVRRALLGRAYGDALAQARQLATVIGAPRLRPLELTLDGNEMRPLMMRAVAADAAPPPFDPAELPTPRDRLSMSVRFCAE